MRHFVMVEAFLGDSAYGDRYEDPAGPVECNKEERLVLVRNATGDDVQGDTILRTRLSYGPLFPLGSRVTLDSGRVVAVLQRAEHEDRGLGAWQHLEVVCG